MKQRTITAIILLAICIPLLLLGSYYLAVAVAIIGCMAGYELLSAHKKQQENSEKYPLLTVIFVFIGIISLVFLNYSVVDGKASFYFDFQEGIMTKIGFSPEILLLFLIFMLGSSVFSQRFKITDAFYIFTMVVFLTFGLQSFLYIRSLPLNLEMGLKVHYQPYSYEALNGIYLCLYLLIVTMMTDTGAYIGGMLYRKTNKPIHYVAPRISPKKTVEGAICGSVCGTLIGSLFFIFVVSPYELTLPWYVVIILTFLLTITAQIGDLIFSCVKRHYQIKDFSHLLPGHGGVLDRIDSLILNSIVLGLFLFLCIQMFGLFVG